MRILLGSGGFRTPERIAFLAAQMRAFFGAIDRLLFLPYALRDHDGYVQTMTERGINGKIIFTSSWVQDVPWPDITPYNVTKSGIKMLMRGMARELAAKGIRVNSVAPGIVAVGMAKRQWDTEPDYRRRAQKAIPLGYMQPPESVADALIFLSSDASDYITGATLLVDGGSSLYPMD